MKNFGAFTYEIIRMTLLNLQVCSDCPLEKSDILVDAVQQLDPAGTTHNWQLMTKGIDAPVECERGGRWHYKFEC